MQKINYSEQVVLKEKITELLMINIDERLEQTNDNDCIKIAGEIRISGEVRNESGTDSFNKPILVDIMISKEQVIANEVNVTIDDFNYNIDKHTIDIDIIMKIDGLKEIDAYFPTQEDQETIQIDQNEINRNNDNYFNENINETQIDIKEEPISESKEINELDVIKEETLKKETKFSLLSQIFKNKSLKKESSYLLHVVKNETSYEEIAKNYDVDIEKLIKVNNEEDIFQGKLIFIPKQ